MTDTKPPVHISVVLDRSGSMGAIADDVVGGFNEFLDRQKQEEGEARVSLVQFDGQNPFEVLTDAIDVAEVRPLSRTTYRPRGNTPLFDAVGRMIARIDAGIALRKTHRLPEEDHVVLIITDGLENASREFDRATIFSLIEKRRADGWVFTFLGADQDAYAEGGRIGVAPMNRRTWEKSAAGVRKMYGDVAYSVSEHRSKPMVRRRAEADEFLKEEPGK